MPPSCLLYRRLWAQVDAVLGQGSSSSSIKAAVVISHAVKRAMVSAIYSSMPPQQQQAASRHSSSDDLSSFSSQPVQDLVLLHVSGNGSAELMQQVPAWLRQKVEAMLDAKSEVVQWGLRQGLPEDEAGLKAVQAMCGPGGVQHLLQLAEEARRDRESCGVGGGEEDVAACGSRAGRSAQEPERGQERGEEGGEGSGIRSCGAGLAGGAGVACQASSSNSSSCSKSSQPAAQAARGSAPAGGERAAAAAAAAAAAGSRQARRPRGPRSKPGTSCAACGATRNDVGRFKVCAGCDTTCYCDRECQRKHWKEHRKECGGRAAQR
jgi:hypothetical protein